MLRSIVRSSVKLSARRPMSYYTRQRVGEVQEEVDILKKETEDLKLKFSKNERDIVIVATVLGVLSSACFVRFVST